MRLKFFLSIPIYFILNSLFGQTIEKVSFNSKSPDEYYLMVKPEIELIRGVLVLLPGFGERAEAIFPETKLINVGYGSAIMTVSIAGGAKLYADDQVIDKLNRGLSHLLKKFPNLSKDQFVLGGFSAGGTIALRYAEYCAANPNLAPIKPRGVFTVDSPIDLGSIWNYFQREIKKNYSEVGVYEAKTVSEMMEKEIGTPSSNPKRYNELTPFNHLLDGPGNEYYLKDMAVRVYEDIDVEWQLNKRRRSLYDSNALDASELINRLVLMGNERAEFMTARSPGYRSNGMRHPHSWSIVDEVECMQWALQLLTP